MVRTFALVSSLILLLAASAAAQAPLPEQPAPVPAAPPSLKPNDLRHQIYVMEGALVRAVQYGAQQYNRQLRTMSQELAMLAGDAEARGVYLDGYGVFFGVGVPIVRQSMMWSVRTFYEQDDQNLKAIVASLREVLSKTRDLGVRREIEGNIARLELQLGINQRGGLIPQPVGQGQGSREIGAQIVTPGSPDAPAPEAARQQGQAANPQGREFLQDPGRAYTEAVQRAIIEAMIDYAQPMLIGPDEWLTVAARDNEPRDSLAPQDPFEEVVTWIYRIKGSDLAAYRAGQIDRVEAMKRVQVKDF